MNHYNTDHYPLTNQCIRTVDQESASLADKLVQDQVTRAQEAEEVYALKNQLSVTQQQLRDTHNKLEEAEDIIGDIRRRVSVLLLLGRGGGGGGGIRRRVSVLLLLGRGGTSEDV